MGRRRLLPNINSVLLRLHLPRHITNGNENGRCGKNHHHEHHHDHEDLHDDSGNHSSRKNTNSGHLHVFSWHSLKRRLAKECPSSSSSSLSSPLPKEETVLTVDDDDDATTTADSTCLTTSQHNDDDHDPNHDPESDHPHHHRHSVSFGNCEVRTYLQVLGDHPCCTEGCPIQLGWSYTEEQSVKVDDYESSFHSSLFSSSLSSCHSEDGTSTRQRSQELRLTPEERRSILLHARQLMEQQNQATDPTGYSSSSGSNTLGACESGTDDRQHERHQKHDYHQQQQRERLSPKETQRTTKSTTTTTTTTTNHSHVDPPVALHERELSRECRRLQRCNANVKASRKRNKRNQEAFFGFGHAWTATATAAATTTLTTESFTIPPETCRVNPGGGSGSHVAPEEDSAPSETKEEEQTTHSFADTRTP